MKRRTFLQNSATALAATSLGANVQASAPPRKTTLTAVGDCILTRRISHLRDPRFKNLVRLLREQDCVWGNCELVLRDKGEGYPQLKYIDANLMNEPWAADEFAALGIGMMGTANNHSLDYGVDGLFATWRHLDRAGISHTGSGLNLAEAARACFRDTTGGRIGMVNFASTYWPGAEASDAHPYMEARPGLCPLKVDWVTELTQSDFDRFVDINHQINALFGMGDYETLKQQDPGERIQFGEYPIIVGEKTGIFGEVKQAHLDRITAAVQAARNQADLVLATVHGHEGLGGHDQTTPFMETVARACIDAGADAFIVAGPHRLRGIEIYKGKPIFYSLGNFIYQFNTIRALPAELMMYKGVATDTLDLTRYMGTDHYRKNAAYWQTVLPLMTFTDGKLTAMQLLPVSLDFEAPLHEQGTPRMAGGEEAAVILDCIQRLSKPYGTTFSRDGESLQLTL